MKTYTNTPGPWTAGTSIVKGVEHFTVVAHKDRKKIIAMTGLCDAKDEAESIGNTLAIAALPDLLKACETLIAYCDKTPPMGDSLWSVKQIRAALKKATTMEQQNDPTYPYI